MVPALGIAASLLSDIGFKAIKGLSSGQKSQSTTQEGITDQSAVTGQNVPAKSTRPDISQLFSKIDTDGSGSISKEEFMAFKQKIDSAMSALLKTQEDATRTSATSDTSNQTSLADQLFSKLDANNDGSLSQDELNSVMSHGRKHGHHSQGVGNFMNALLNLQSESSSSTSGGTSTASTASVTSTSSTSTGTSA